MNSVETGDYAATVNTEALDFGTIPANKVPITFAAHLTNRGVNDITPAVVVQGEAFSSGYEAVTLSRGNAVDIPVTLTATKAVANVRYFNAAGLAADKAFDGVNIVVTTYTDGTQSVSKVVNPNRSLGFRRLMTDLG